MKQRIFGRSRPSYAYELQYRRQLQALIKEMEKDTRSKITGYWNTRIVTDSADDDDNKEKRSSGRTQIMAALRSKWYEKFEKTGKKITAWFAGKANRRTNEQITRKLRQIGWTRKQVYTDAHTKLIRDLAENSVSYIKSIPQKYLRNVQGHVAEAVERGGDRHYLAEELAKLYEELGSDGERAFDYAALVARDQSNKMTQGYALVNAESYGATKGRWIHVQGLKSSRSTHVAMDGQEFLLEKGIFDEDVGTHVKPGELPYCQCQFEVLLPGFED